MADKEVFMDREQKEYTERVISIDRVARVQKGGRRFRFRAVSVVGDGKGKVGMGIAKAGDVTSAVTKATAKAKKAMITVPLYRHGTIGYEVLAKHAGAKVLLKPASPGTGVIAGGAVREVLEVAGVTDVLSKSLGSSNKINTTYATLEAFKELAKYYAQYDEHNMSKKVAKSKEGVA